MDFIDTYVNTALLTYTHVAAGFVALVVAPIAMLTKKGGKQHRRWGKVYFWAMFVIFVTALALVYVRPNFFLFIISILSFYAAFTGYRSLYRKRPDRGEGATALDWGVTIIALLAAGSFAIWGILNIVGFLSMEIPRAFGFLGVGFGYFLGIDAYKDLRSYQQPPADRNWWWYYHVERMSGSYVAAVTAFTVQNLSRYMPELLLWVPWVLLGLIGGLLISRTLRHYRRKFKQSDETSVAGNEVVPAG